MGLIALRRHVSETHREWASGGGLDGLGGGSTLTPCQMCPKVLMSGHLPKHVATFHTKTNCQMCGQEFEGTRMLR